MHAIDTHAAVQRLEQAGLEKTAAEAITSLYAEAVTATISDLATKSDLQTEIQAVKSDLQAVKSDLQAVNSDIEAVETPLETKIQVQTQTLKAHITYVVVGGDLAVVIIIALLIKLL